MSLSIFILIILLVLTAMLAGLEMVISSTNRIKIKTKAEHGDIKAQKALKYLENYDETITTIIVLNNIINIIIPTISTVIFIGLFKNNQEFGVVLSTVLITIILLVFGEIIPKTYGKRNSETLIYQFINFIEFVVTISKPITWIFLKINSFFINYIFKPKKNESQEIEEELLTIIDESSQQGALEVEEGELIKNAIEFSEIRVDEILQPKSNIVMIEIDDDIEYIYTVLTKKMYSRIPVYEKNTDNIIGVISEREFLREYGKGRNFKLRELLKSVDFVPDTLKISKLLVKMQKEHAHMSIVVDEYGTVQGIITIEDILEELVGEIWDEHDEIVDECKKIREGVYQVIGNFPIEDFNELFENYDVSINTETEDFTVAGYILEIAERIPDVNEIIEDENFIFKILKTESQKIELIEVQLKKAPH